MAQKTYESESPVSKDDFLTRIRKIKDFPRVTSIINDLEEGRQRTDAPKLKAEIEKLTSHIRKLIATYNLALDNNLPLVEDDWCVKSHNQKIGFVDSSEEYIHYMGISLPPEEQVYQAGNEELVLCTNGHDTFCTNLYFMDEVRVPAAVYMERFLQEFEAFETRFYTEVDNILEAQKQKLREYPHSIDDLLSNAIAKSNEGTLLISRDKERDYTK